jgi:hypothetical protein
LEAIAFIFLLVAIPCKLEVVQVRYSSRLCWSNIKDHVAAVKSFSDYTSRLVLGSAPRAVNTFIDLQTADQMTPCRKAEQGRANAWLRNGVPVCQMELSGDGLART